MMAAALKPTIEDVWEWLKDVPDPEIPVVSVVDLGIVRDIAWNEDELVVTVTPTYSGCPATAVISISIEEELRKRGVEKVRIETQLAPPWTTAWITEEARRKLKDYGIAPPLDSASCAGALTASEIACPRCDSKDVECVSQFGSTPCKAHYRCCNCLEPFDYFKCI